MGYYVIPDPQSVPLQSFYVENYADIVLIGGISGKSIIYPGSVENQPVRVEESEAYSRLGKEWYIAGIRAQHLFARLACDHRYIVEEINQDITSFDAYRQAVVLPVKRGDFLIRNLGNLEIEVKCRTFYRDQGEKFFYFSKDDLEKHYNMQCYSSTPVVIAVFERKGEYPLEETLCMIQVDRIRQLETVLKIETKEYGIAYRIPLRETVAGFHLLEDYEVGPSRDTIRTVTNAGKSYRPVKELIELNEPDESSVLVVYFKNAQHLDWIISQGIYNIRRDSIQKRFGLHEGTRGVKYLLLHTDKEMFTNRLFEVVGGDPVLWTAQELRSHSYPSEPTCSAYWIYQIRKARNFEGKCWNLRALFERVTKYPKMIGYSELSAEAFQVGKTKLDYPRTNLNWTPEDDALMEQLFDAGATLEEMARRFKRKPSAIYLHIEKMGLRKRKK